MKTKSRFCRGFTMAELLIVVAIIGVLVAVAIPVFGQAIDQAKASTCLSNMRSLKSSLTVTWMLDEDADAVKAEFDQDKGLCKCPSGGEITYALDQKTNIVTVSCGIHSPDAYRRVASSLESLFAADTADTAADIPYMINGKPTYKTTLGYLQAYFSRYKNQSTSLDSTGTNFGDALKTGISKLVGVSGNYDYRIYREANSDTYKIYVFEPIKDLVVDPSAKGDDVIKVNAVGYEFKANDALDLTKGLTLVAEKGVQQVPVTTKTVDGQKINVISAASYDWDAKTTG